MQTEIQQRLVLLAQSSDDPDTQTACVITNDSGVVLVGASNKLPLQVKHTPERVRRPVKYSYIGHAEARAISWAAQCGTPLAGATAWLNWFPCAQCAGTLINAGVKKLVADKGRYLDRVNDPRYDFAVAMEMLVEAGIEIEWFDE